MRTILWASLTLTLGALQPRSLSEDVNAAIDLAVRNLTRVLTAYSGGIAPVLDASLAVHEVNRHGWDAAITAESRRIVQNVERGRSRWR
jgi:hypothetical protein